MKLLSLSVRNHCWLRDSNYDFVTDSKPSDVIIISGGPGSGKTGLLELIASVKESIGSYGGVGFPNPLARDSDYPVEVTSVWFMTEKETQIYRSGRDIIESSVQFPKNVLLPNDHALSDFLSTYTHEEDGKMEYFPSNRSLGSSGIKYSDLESERRLRISKNPNKYSSVRYFLTKIETDSALQSARMLRDEGIRNYRPMPDPVSKFNSILKGFTNQIAFHGLSSGKHQNILFENSHGRILELDELSESQKQAVLFAATASHIGLNNSIVLIDEPELHLHHSMHTEMLKSLHYMGNDNQLFVATGSESICKSSGKGYQLVELK